MTESASSWVHGYLHALAGRGLFREARAVAPLWLSGEDGAPAGQPRLTIQMAAELYPRLVVTGPAGAGKTTALRQLACGMAEALLVAEGQGEASPPAVSGLPPLPVYLELARFSGDIPAALVAAFGPGAPPLAALVRGRPAIFLLDGLDELAPAAQLSCLSALSRAFASLGGQVRWVATCRAESLPLFRPWLGDAQVRQLRPLRPRDVLALVRQQAGDELANWLERAAELVELATRPRWLAALVRASAGGALATPFTRAGVLAAWLPSVLDAALAAHALPAELSAVYESLPALAAALDQREADALPAGEVCQLLPAQGALELLAAAAILVLDAEQQVSFRHPLLRSFAHAQLLARGEPGGWRQLPAGRTASDALALAYSLVPDRVALLRRLLASGAAATAARCLAENEAPERFDALLAHTGVLTPGMRLALADAFAVAGLPGAAREQLERAGAEGYDEPALFGRLGELYAASGEWRLARAAYEQALARAGDDLRYRQQLGVVWSRLGELDRASAALEAVLDAQQRNAAAAAHELGQVYLQQGQAERALDAFRQAVAGQPGEPSYRRSA
ncbi:MAG TPA: hypothetical protein VNL77_02310, partial [Roseiflexaceae bacterium]|nr:hypothetical protein [Roseiflexaceae bacterium]